MQFSHIPNFAAGVEVAQCKQYERQSRNRRRHECGSEARAIDHDATALSRCEEFTGSAPKIVPPMRAVATDRIHVFGPTRDFAKQLPKVADQFTPRFAV